MLKRTLAVGGNIPNIGSRIGVASLTRLSFNGGDLGALWNDLLASIRRDPGNASIVMDMSVVAQLLGNPNVGAELQDGALATERLRPECPQ